VIALPPAIAPPAPFPLIVAQSGVPEFVAPGIRRADYRLMTSDGPLVIHVVAIDTSDPSVRLGTVVAHDRMISAGETVSSMARRTHAVAGINADYFDITNTNQPLNVVVRDGVLERTPSKRVALLVGADRGVSIDAVGFAGTYTDGETRTALTSVNEWPPNGGVAFVTPAYGALPATPGVQLAQLAPVDAVAGMPGTYRVTSVGPALAGPVTGPALGFGPAALSVAPPPSPGDLVQLAFDTTPPAASLASAVGGGPLLVRGGAVAVDPDSPAPEETNVRFPVAGAMREADGTLLFIVVDGRNRARSIGLTRPQFGALMRGFGAVDGMAFDSGGSATLVARELGDAEATVVNDPSDGVERPVADGLFVYSDAPAGVHPHLILRPPSLTIVPGADLSLALRGAIVDDAGHLLRPATLAPVAVADVTGTYATDVRDASGTYVARLPYRVTDAPAKLAIAAVPANPAPGQAVDLRLAAFDANGGPVAFAPVRARWTLGASVVRQAALHVADPQHDFSVTASLAHASAALTVRVGSHAVPVPLADITLAYDLTGTARAAYAPAAVDLPGEPLAFAIDVFGDGNGEPLRAAFVNRYGERHALTLAKHVDWQGWQRVSVALPPDLNPPIRLTTLYVVPSLGGPAVRAAGTLRFRSASVVVPGMQ
jgi:hypothetical protein